MITEKTINEIQLGHLEGIISQVTGKTISEIQNIDLTFSGNIYKIGEKLTLHIWDDEKVTKFEFKLNVEILKKEEKKIGFEYCSFCKKETEIDDDEEDERCLECGIMYLMM